MLSPTLFCYYNSCQNAVKIPNINIVPLNTVYLHKFLKLKFYNLYNYHLQQVSTLKIPNTCTWIHTKLSTLLASWADKAPLKNISTAICKCAKVLWKARVEAFILQVMPWRICRIEVIQWKTSSMKTRPPVSLWKN